MRPLLTGIALQRKIWEGLFCHLIIISKCLNTIESIGYYLTYFISRCFVVLFVLNLKKKCFRRIKVNGLDISVMYIHIHIKKKKRVVWVRRDLFKDYPVPTPCHGWGHLPPDQVEIFSCMCMCSPGFITFKTELVIAFNNKQYSDLNFFSRVLSQKKKKLPSIYVIDLALVELVWFRW